MQKQMRDKIKKRQDLRKDCPPDSDICLKCFEQVKKKEQFTHFKERHGAIDFKNLPKE